MKKLFLSLSAVFASIPGLATILTGLGAPPGFKLLFGGTIEAFGTLALLVVALNRANLQRRSIKYVTRLAIFFGATFAACLCAYLMIIKQCVISDCEKTGEVFFPIWLRGALKEEVQLRGGSRYDTLCSLQDWVRRELDKSRTDINASVVILLVLYNFNSTTLVLAFAYPAFYIKQPGHILAIGKSLPDGDKLNRAKIFRTRDKQSGDRQQKDN